jgi:carbon monoxide dehydrogenase subunit G
MVSWIRATPFLALALRTLVPLAIAFVTALWLGGLGGGAVAGVAAALALLGLWGATGFAGDPARAGSPRLEVPALARLAGEVGAVLGAVTVLAWGLDAPVLAVVLAIAGAFHLALRPGDLRSAATSRTTPAEAPPHTQTAAAASFDAGQPPPDWSKRGEQGSFQFGRTITVRAPLGEVWRFVWDFEKLALCIPGCEEVQEHEPHRSYTARVRKKLGPFLIRMPLEIEIEEYDEERFVRAAVVGRDQRMRSEVHQQLRVTLIAAPEGCQLRSVIDVSIRGVLATVDAQLIERHLDQTISEFTQSLDAQLTTAPTA